MTLKILYVAIQIAGAAGASASVVVHAIHKAVAIRGVATGGLAQAE